MYVNLYLIALKCYWIYIHMLNIHMNEMGIVSLDKRRCIQSSIEINRSPKSCTNLWTLESKYCWLFYFHVVIKHTDYPEISHYFQVIIVAVLIAFIMRKPVEDEKLSVDLASVRKQAKKYRPSENSEFLGNY